MKEKSMQEKLASRYKRTRKIISRFEKYLEITPEEGEWIRENEAEFRDIINTTENDKRYSLVAIDQITDNQAVLIMSE